MNTIHSTPLNLECESKQVILTGIKLSYKCFLNCALVSSQKKHKKKASESPTLSSVIKEFEQNKRIGLMLCGTYSNTIIPQRRQDQAKDIG